MFKILTTGKFYADGGAMFGAVPKVTWSRSYPADARNLCILSMHTGLVKTPDGRIIIIDPGVGTDCLKDSPAVFYGFHEMQDLVVMLRESGVEPAEVTDVVFTHLHFDHAGGAISGSKPLFPNAIHYVSRRQYEYEKSPHPLEHDSFLPNNTQQLEKAGLLQIVDDRLFISGGSSIGRARQITPYFTLHIYDGHTPGQLAATVITSDSRTVVFPGDIIPLASHVVPERISAYDINSGESYFSKMEILERVVADGSLTVFYHDVFMPFARVKRVGKSYKAIE